MTGKWAKNCRVYAHFVPGECTPRPAPFVYAYMHVAGGVAYLEYIVLKRHELISYLLTLNPFLNVYLRFESCLKVSVADLQSLFNVTPPSAKNAAASVQKTTKPMTL